MKLIFLSLLIVSLFATTSFADDVCATIQECKALQDLAEQKIKALEVKEFSDFVRNSDGSIRKMERKDAYNYCLSQNMTLPTAKELAQLSASLGAVGLSETNKEGYVRFSYKNMNKTKEAFYFNSKDYVAPSGDFGIFEVWSQSYIGGSGFWDVTLAFNAKNGQIYEAVPWAKIPVRCVK